MDLPLASFRPAVTYVLPPDDPVAAFYHQVMRPVLKQINDALSDIFYEQCGALPVGLTGEEKEAWIKKRLSARPGLAASLEGAFLAWLTQEERAFYFAHRPALGKRIKTLLMLRLAAAWR